MARFENPNQIVQKGGNDRKMYIPAEFPSWAKGHPVGEREMRIEVPYVSNTLHHYHRLKGINSQRGI